MDFLFYWGKFECFSEAIFLFVSKLNGIYPDETGLEDAFVGKFSAGFQLD